MFLLEQSKYFSIHQSENKRQFYVDFGQKKVKLSFCELLVLRNKVNAITVDSLFDSDSNPHAFEIVTLCNHQHLFIFNIYEILDLKSVIQNTFAAMGLSSQLVPVTV